MYLYVNTCQPQKPILTKYSLHTRVCVGVNLFKYVPWPLCGNLPTQRWGCSSAKACTSPGQTQGNTKVTPQQGKYDLNYVPLKVNLLCSHKGTGLEDSGNICKVFGKLRLGKLGFDTQDRRQKEKCK